MTAPKNVKIGLALFFSNALIGIPSTSLQIYYAPPELHRSVMVIGAAILFSILIFIGIKMVQGSNVFRKINAVLAIGGSLFSISGLSTPTFYHPAGVYFFWVSTVITLSVVGLLFTPSANSWFWLQSNSKA